MVVNGTPLASVPVRILLQPPLLVMILLPFLLISLLGIMTVMLNEFRWLQTYIGDRINSLEARIGRVESDVSALRQYFLLAQAHVPPTSHANANVDNDDETDSDMGETTDGAAGFDEF